MDGLGLGWNRRAVGECPKGRGVWIGVRIEEWGTDREWIRGWIGEWIGNGSGVDGAD
jgi:hypothetical protein